MFGGISKGRKKSGDFFLIRHTILTTTSEVGIVSGLFHSRARVCHYFTKSWSLHTFFSIVNKCEMKTCYRASLTWSTRFSKKHLICIGFKLNSLIYKQRNHRSLNLIFPVMRFHFWVIFIQKWNRRG